MAVLNIEAVRTLWRSVFREGDGKEECKEWATLPTGNQIQQSFQAIEDRTTAAFALAKADIETILGHSITATAMKKLGRAWLRWRDSQGG